MTLLQTPLPAAPTSALQELLSLHSSPEESSNVSKSHYLALQIAHNLRFQHTWRELRIHDSSSDQLLPRPIISGLPPQRLYVHPDEQNELLKKQNDEGKTGMPELESEREWVVPSQLREKWSLQRLGEIFDALPTIPLDGEGGLPFDEKEDTTVEPLNHAWRTREGGEPKANPWRTTQPKRMLLAVADDDSTVVYYIVHDGIVKPRQN